MGRRQRKRAQQGTGTGEVAPSARYTPPETLHVRYRPTWHKVIGWVTVALGFTLVFVNFLEADFLPGGHNEGYFLGGILFAATSLWWFGAMDRDPDPAEIRREIERQREARAEHAKGAQPRR